MAENNNKFLKEKEMEGQLAVDLYQTEEELVLQAIIAGNDKDSLEINTSNESVTIKGERKKPEEIDKDKYLLRECFWGKFSRSVILPCEIDPDKVKAILKNGILTIRMPKLSRTKARKVNVVIE